MHLFFGVFLMARKNICFRRKTMTAHVCNQNHTDCITTSFFMHSHVEQIFPNECFWLAKSLPLQDKNRKQRWLLAFKKTTFLLRRSLRKENKSKHTSGAKDEINVPIALSAFRDNAQAVKNEFVFKLGKTKQCANCRHTLPSTVTFWAKCFIFGRPGYFWCLPLSGISRLPVWSHFSVYPLLFFCLVLSLFLSYPFLLLAHSPDLFSPKPPFSER